MLKQRLSSFVNANSIRWLLAETLVVVLGISIAFQVDEYRLARISHTAEQKAVQALIDDLRSDSLQLAEFRAITTSQSEAFARLGFHFDSNKELSSDSLLHFFRIASLGRIWTPATAAFDGLRDSGKLDLVSDPSLRGQLSNYFGGWRYYFKNLADEYSLSVDQFIDAGGQDIILVPSEVEDGLRYRPKLIGTIEEFPKDPHYRSYLGRSGSFSLFMLSRIARAEELRMELQHALQYHHQDM